MGNDNTTYEYYFLKDDTKVQFNPRKGVFKKKRHFNDPKFNVPLVGDHKLYEYDKKNKKIVVSGVFNEEGRLPNGRLWRDGHNWFKGDLNKDLTPDKGTEWYPHTKTRKFNGTYSGGTYWHGTVFDLDGKEIMRGTLKFWKSPPNDGGSYRREPPFAGWHLYKGRINVESPTYVCKGCILEGCLHNSLGGNYQGHKEGKRLVDGVLEEGLFTRGFLINGTRTEDLGNGRQKISRLRDGKVMNQEEKKKKPEVIEVDIRSSKPSAPPEVAIQLPPVGEPDVLPGEGGDPLPRVGSDQPGGEGSTY